MTLKKNENADVNWQGWSLSENPFAEEFDEAARLRMIAGGKRIIPFIEKYQAALQGFLLEIGPFFNPLLLSEELWSLSEKTLAPHSDKLFLENDPHAIRWLQTTFGANVIALDLNIADLHANLSEALFLQYKKAVFFNAVIISQVLNYVDFRVFLTAVYDSTQYGGFVFINNVVDYGITPLFSENRPMNNAELQEFVTQMGFQIIEKTEIAPFFAQEKQPRLILILQKK